MTEQVENVIIGDIDEYGIVDDVEESLREDNISESCYTNFKDILVETIGHIISEILEKDGWKLKKFGELTMFNEKDSEELFNAFMKNSEFTVTLKKKISEQKYEFKKVIIKFDIPENKKKKIAETYINNLLEGYYYLDICIFIDLDEINVNELSKVLSEEVYGLLSPDEIKAKFKNKIEEAIKVIDDEQNYDDVDDINEEEE